MRQIFILSLITFFVAKSPSRADKAVRVPFEYASGLIWMPVQINDSKPLNFLFDTGAEQSVIDLRTAKDLGIRFTGSEVVSRVGGDEIAYLTPDVELRLVELTTWSAPLLALDLHPESQGVRRKIDGLIGTDFMAGRAFRIDYRSNILELNPIAARRGSKTIPIRMHCGNPCISVTVGGSNTLPNVRIDTGCNQSLHWSPVDLGQSYSGPLTIGSLFKRMRTKRTDVLLGATRFKKVATTRHSRPIFPGEQGLLGNPLLARFGVVTLDFGKRRLILEGR